MAPVPPGDKTGLYYILVANLPWSCTWQKLKDHTRNHPDGTFINVDHAYVYPSSSSSAMCSGYGWVRIIGKLDFKKALAHLNGGLFENRSLMADGRNETKTTQLRDIGSTRQYSAHKQHEGTSSFDIIPNLTTNSTISQLSDVSPSTSPYSGQQNHQNWNNSVQPSYTPKSPVVPHNRAFYQNTQSYESSQGQFHLQTNQDYYAIPTATVMYVSTPVYTCMPVAGYVSVPPGISGSFSQTTSPQAVPATTTAVSQGSIQPEARKVILTRLSHDIKEHELEALLRRVCSSYRSRTQSERERPIHSISLPRHPDYKQKGHAFIVVDTEGLAEHIVSALNGVKFQGRSLGAKFAKEGVEPVGGYNNNESEPQYYNSQPQLASPFMLQDPQSAFSGESGEERAPLAQKEKIDRAKKSEKESSRSRDKEKKQPLVADGSGGRRRRR